MPSELIDESPQGITRLF